MIVGDNDVLPTVQEVEDHFHFMVGDFHCGCGVWFASTREHTECWECRVIGDPPSKRLPLPVPPLRSWSGWGTAGIGGTS